MLLQNVQKSQKNFFVNARYENEREGYKKKVKPPSS